MEEIMNNIRTKNIDYSCFSITQIKLYEGVFSDIVDNYYLLTAINLNDKKWKSANTYRIFNGSGTHNCHLYFIKPDVDIIQHLRDVYDVYNKIIKKRDIHLKIEYEDDWKFEGDNLILLIDQINIFTLISIYLQEYGYEEAVFVLGRDFNFLFKEDERFKK